MSASRGHSAKILDPLDPEYDPEQLSSSRSKREQESRPPKQPQSQPQQPRFRPPPAAVTHPTPQIYPSQPFSPQCPWTEHKGPNGISYYYNHKTQQSTWERPAELDQPQQPKQHPLPPQPPLQPQQQLPINPQQQLPINPQHQIQAHAPQQLPQRPSAPAATADDGPPGSALVAKAPPIEEQPAAKPDQVVPKERCLALKKIPGTSWSIVLTNQDHEFYHNSDTKESVWEMPDELGELLGELMAQAMGVPDDDDLLDDDEASIDSEVDEDEDDDENDSAEDDDDKNDDGYGLDRSDSDNDGRAVAEKSSAMIQDRTACVETAKASEPSLRAMEDTGADEDLEVGTEHGTKRKLDTDESQDATSDTQRDDSKRAKPQESRPPAASLSQEDKIKLFMSLLRDLDISPFSTWEKELPKIIHDDRYTVLPTLKERRQTFENYCKVRVVEIREERKTQAKDSKESFLKLLQEHCSYRSTFDEFQRKHKRDPRFSGVDAKERESLFKDHIKALRDSELDRKRQETKEAKDRFMELLRDTDEIRHDSEWYKVKRLIQDDRRYQGVLAMHEREAYFQEYIKELVAADETLRVKKEKEAKERQRREREEASLREREAQVRRERGRFERERREQLSTLRRDEAIQLFKGILTDSIRSHKTHWSDKVTALERDPRYQQISRALPERDQKEMFYDHLDAIFQKRLQSFHRLLEETIKYSTLTLPFAELLPMIRNGSETERLELQDLEKELEPIVERWREQKIKSCRAGVHEALESNNFIRFHIKNVVQSVEATAVEKGEVESPADIKNETIVAALGLQEITKVLEDDPRWVIFHVFPEERMSILKSFIESAVHNTRAEKGGTLDKTLSRHMGGRA
ncbi:uncharacterized protein BJ171DRAFT_110739 [Polychytrium aggregatum]|uniref:uncharacterized protein n=1 Tax=Polychytrium aggregatum TaxID=110093 RepID=UPI0022FF0337|nr:uncharacterized protein BJ171DRAFT_110739 [Polychytrium aggregatum]KAI9209178.1 hypothetical protein BJ171DRAFT_110739 [Polychytrium aggregatum]